MLRPAIFVGALAALSLSISTAWAAGPTPAGPAFRASQCTTCKQEFPSVAGQRSGAYLVVWEGSTATDLRGVVARAFTTKGNPRGGDLQVARANLTRPQYDAAVAVDKQGNYIAVWAESSDDNSDIMAQKFNSTGTPVGAAILVSADDPAAPAPPTDYFPAVAAGTDGGFVVVWIRVIPPSASAPGGPAEVYARRFNASGAPVGAQVKVSTGLIQGNQPDVCVDSTNRAVAVWASLDSADPFEANKKGVVGRRISATGTVTERVFTAAPPEYFQDTEPAVSCGKGDVFVVVWTTDRPPAVDGPEIVGRRFTKLARPSGNPFRINSRTAGAQRSPSIIHDAAGNFLVAWDSEDLQTYGIHGRRFAAAGTPSSDDFEVVSKIRPINRPGNPDLSFVGQAGDFVVIWQEGSSGGIFGRRFKNPARKADF